MRKRRDVKKRPIDAERIRQIPDDGFSWIDRRFVREGFIEPLAPEAILLYFFLVSVSDAHGLSFYADPTVSRILKPPLSSLLRPQACLPFEAQTGIGTTCQLPFWIPTRRKSRGFVGT